MNASTVNAIKKVMGAAYQLAAIFLCAFGHPWYAAGVFVYSLYLMN
jgi:hypothetical protein